MGKKYTHSKKFTPMPSVCQSQGCWDFSPTTSRLDLFLLRQFPGQHRRWPICQKRGYHRHRGKKGERDKAEAADKRTDKEKRPKAKCVIKVIVFQTERLSSKLYNDNSGLHKQYDRTLVFDIVFRSINQKDITDNQQK